MTTPPWEPIAVVVATLLGPILAVQAQKIVETWRNQKERRRRIFAGLMATRATILDVKHVEALNAVPIEFYGSSRPLRAVVEAWKLYLDHLNGLGSEVSEPPPGWNETRTDLFLDMLGKMAACLNYKFGKLELKKEVYYPRGHAAEATDLEVIRTGFASLLRGDKALPMELRADDESVAREKELQTLLLAWLSGKATPRVHLDSADAPPRRAVAGS